MNLLLATTNYHKEQEVREVILRELGEAQVFSLRDMENPPKFEESGESFIEIARSKATFYSEWLWERRLLGWYVLSEDAGLEIALLDGFPGVFSNRIGESDKERISIVLERLKKVDKEDLLSAMDETLSPEMRMAKGFSRPSRAARFVSAMALAKDKKILFDTTGIVNGLIAFKPLGENGFGYDPIFFYPPLGRTFGQLSRKEKVEVSHRTRALKKVVEFIRNLASASGDESKKF